MARWRSQKKQRLHGPEFAACHFVAEDGRRDDHAGVKALAVHFQIRSAREGRLDAHQYFSAGDSRNRDLFDPNVTLAVEHGRGHLVPGNLDEISHGCMTTFSDSWEG